MFAELRPGSSPSMAIRALNELSIDAESVMGGIDTDIVKQSYLTWVTKAEGQLRNVFSDPDVWERLYSDIHWRIRSMGDEETRPLRVIELELRRQRERLDALLTQINEIRNWVNRSAGRCVVIDVVIDTNVLLHYLPADQIDWTRVIGTRNDVRIIVPLRVVNELDAKKYVRDDKIGKRARSVLSQLGNALLATENVPTQVADGVTLEVAPFNEPREPPLDADWEILTCCLTLAPYSPNLHLATGDTTMRIRAKQLGIDARELPADYLRAGDA